MPYRFHAAHRFHASYILHLVFGCFALMFGGALYLQETSASMSAFGRDVIFVIGLVLLPGRWYAQRVAAHDFQRGYVVGGAVWAAANLLGWVSLTHHLRSASSSVGTLSLELTVGWAIAHVFFSTQCRRRALAAAQLARWAAAWPSRVFTAFVLVAPVVATVLHPQYTPLPAQRTVFCCALLLGWVVAQVTGRRHHHHCLHHHHHLHLTSSSSCRRWTAQSLMRTLRAIRRNSARNSLTRLLTSTGTR